MIPATSTIIGLEAELTIQIALRAIETVDLMTARRVQLPYEFLDLCARDAMHRGNLALGCDQKARTGGWRWTAHKNR